VQLAPRIGCRIDSPARGGRFAVERQRDPVDDRRKPGIGKGLLPATTIARVKIEVVVAVAQAARGTLRSEVLPVFELTMRNLLNGGQEVDRRDFLARADLLSACGMTVLISDYFEYYRLAAYLSWRTKERIGIVLALVVLAVPTALLAHATMRTSPSW